MAAVIQNEKQQLDAENAGASHKQQREEEEGSTWPLSEPFRTSNVHAATDDNVLHISNQHADKPAATVNARGADEHTSEGSITGAPLTEPNGADDPSVEEVETTKIATTDLISVMETLETNDVKGADVKGVDVKGADVKGADVKGADVKGADVKGADVEGADVEGADVEGADMKGADVESADVEGADVEGADMKGADVEGADMKGADVEGADVEGADVESADVEGDDVKGHTLPSSSESGSTVHKATVLYKVVEFKGEVSQSSDSSDNGVDSTCDDPEASVGASPYFMIDGNDNIPGEMVCPIDPTVLDDVERLANKAAGNLDYMMMNLRNSLYAMTVCMRQMSEIHNESLGSMQKTVDISTKSMYSFLAKFEELNNGLEPLKDLSSQISDISETLKFLEKQFRT